MWPVEVFVWRCNLCLQDVNGTEQLQMYPSSPQLVSVLQLQFCQDIILVLSTSTSSTVVSPSSYTTVAIIIFGCPFPHRMMQSRLNCMCDSTWSRWIQEISTGQTAWCREKKQVLHKVLRFNCWSWNQPHAWKPHRNLRYKTRKRMYRDQAALIEVWIIQTLWHKKGFI